MKAIEITAKDYQQAMPEVWKVVRGYCESDEEAKNTITMAVENYLYDIQGGVSEYQAIQSAMDELYIEQDYMMSFAEGVIALGVEIESNDDEGEDVNDDYLSDDFLEAFAMRELGM